MGRERTKGKEKKERLRNEEPERDGERGWKLVAAR
jgi:hypothetical protein